MSVELKNVTKRFGDLVANDSINLKVEDSQIHAILGENGAGKSTLMNILYGLYSPDSGEFFIDNKLVNIKNPDRKSTRLNSSHMSESRMPSSA